MNEVFRSTTTDSNSSWGWAALIHFVTTSVPLKIATNYIQDNRQRNSSSCQKPSGLSIWLPRNDLSSKTHQTVDDLLDVLRSSSISNLDEHFGCMQVLFIGKKVDGNAKQSVSDPRCPVAPNGEGAKRSRFTSFSNSK